MSKNKAKQKSLVRKPTKRELAREIARANKRIDALYEDLEELRTHVVLSPEEAEVAATVEAEAHVAVINLADHTHGAPILQDGVR